MQQRSMRFPADVTYLASARDFAAATVDELGADVDRDVLALITGELAANAAEHQHEDVELVVRVHADGCVDVEVIDGSPILPEPIEGAPMDPEGHRGLHLVRELSTSWGAAPEEHGKRVWARLAPLHPR